MLLPVLCQWCQLLPAPLGRLPGSRTAKRGKQTQGLGGGQEDGKAECGSQSSPPLLARLVFPGPPGLLRPARLPAVASESVRAGPGWERGEGFWKWRRQAGGLWGGLGPQPAGGGGALNCSLCLDPSPALTPCASLAEGTPAEMPWSGWPRAGLRLTPSSAPVETGCVDSLPAFVLSPHCPSLPPAHLSCVLKLGNGRGGGGGQSPHLPGLTGTAFCALVVSLLLGESRLHGFTKGPPPRGRAAAGGARGHRGLPAVW